jgi:hypothetical protein
VHTTPNPEALNSVHSVSQAGFGGHDGNVPEKGSEAEATWNQMLASMQALLENATPDCVIADTVTPCCAPAHRRTVQYPNRDSENHTLVHPPPAHRGGAPRTRSPALISLKLLMSLNHLGDMEACCVLLATVGDTLDRPRDAAGGCRYVDEYFDRIEHIANDELNHLTQRLRCLLLDLVALRKKGWRVQTASMLSKLLTRQGEEVFVLPKKKKRKKKKILGPNGELLGTETCSGTDTGDSAPDSPAGMPTPYGAALMARMSGKAETGSGGSEGSSVGSDGGGMPNLPWPRRQRSIDSMDSMDASVEGQVTPWSPGTGTDPMSLTYSDSNLDSDSMVSGGENCSKDSDSQLSDGQAVAKALFLCSLTMLSCDWKPPTNACTLTLPTPGPAQFGSEAQ